ncbi:MULTISPECIES: hypothetical protein [Paraburkholderia]|jgi:hypothetical protein|uniref:Uncharacterized protein n=1 Tax=Paraburkholderia phenazinium TaxID=60549 RepID=A0A1N6K0J5_9BURK|nr:hypothetical protein [Paraburkholderia phenazinium]SIO50115.1 hypothetical protein SAMN05444168_5665 [Paraburkholderia phenazinium]
MLFTDANWAESSAFRRAIAKPFQPWRCVGWTDDTICFWVFPAPQSDRTGALPDGLLVVDPAALLDIASELTSGSFSVYVMDAPAEDRPSARMQRVTGLLTQQQIIAPAYDYWYRTEEGDLHPCSRLRHRLPNDAPLQLALNLDAQDCNDPVVDAT